MNKCAVCFSFVVCLVLAAPLSVWAQSHAPTVTPQPTSLTGVTVAPGPIVAITAAGSLPAPAVGVLHSPERIYLDLAGVSSRTSRTPGDGELVTTVRIAQHSLDPLVARVVIELNRASRYHVNTSRREAGRLEISLTAPVSPGPKESAPAATPPATAADPPRPKAMSPSTERYISRVQQALNEASALQSVLRDLDRKTAVAPDQFPLAQAALGRLRGVLDGLHPPPNLTDAHDLLRSAVGFAAAALTLASSSAAEVPGNASSAAAGALMMFERAQAELQKAPSKKLTAQFVGRQDGW